MTQVALEFIKFLSANSAGIGVLIFACFALWCFTR